MAIPAANRQTGRRNDSNMVKSLIQVDSPASPEFARSPGASSGASAFRRCDQDAPYHHPAAGMPSISPGATIPSSPERSVPASPGATSGPHQICLHQQLQATGASRGSLPLVPARVASVKRSSKAGTSTAASHRPRSPSRPPPGA